MPHVFSPRCGVECSLSIPQAICLKNICTPCGSYAASVPMNPSILLLGEAPCWYFLVNYSWEQEPKNSMSLILSHLILMTALWGKYNIISFFILYLYMYWICTSEVIDNILSTTDDTKIKRCGPYHWGRYHYTKTVSWTDTPRQCDEATILLPWRPKREAPGQPGNTFSILLTTSSKNLNNFPSSHNYVRGIIICNSHLQISSLLFFIQH